MRRIIPFLSLLLLSCTSMQGGTSAVSSSASSTSSAEAVSTSSSVDPKAPKIYLQWQEKKLPTIIKGTPRRKLSLIVSGASRQLVYVGTFSGEKMDLAGTYVNAPDAILRASIAWKGSGDEIWVERDKDPAKLIVRHRNIDENRLYLSVDRIIATVNIIPEATVTVRQK